MIGSSTKHWISVKGGVVNGCRVNGARKRGSVGISADAGFALMSDERLFQVDHYDAPDGSVVYIYDTTAPTALEKGLFKSEMV